MNSRPPWSRTRCTQPDRRAVLADIGGAQRPAGVRAITVQCRAAVRGFDASAMAVGPLRVRCSQFRPPPAAERLWTRRARTLASPDECSGRKAGSRRSGVFPRRFRIKTPALRANALRPGTQEEDCRRRSRQRSAARTGSQSALSRKKCTRDRAIRSARLVTVDFMWPPLGAAFGQRFRDGVVRLPVPPAALTTTRRRTAAGHPAAASHRLPVTLVAGRRSPTSWVPALPARARA